MQGLQVFKHCTIAFLIVIEPGDDWDSDYRFLLLSCCKIAQCLQDFLIADTCELLVLFFVDMFEIDENQIKKLKRTKTLVYRKNVYRERKIILGLV